MGAQILPYDALSSYSAHTCCVVILEADLNIVYKLGTGKPDGP